MYAFYRDTIFILLTFYNPFNPPRASYTRYIYSRTKINSKEVKDYIHLYTLKALNLTLLYFCSYYKMPFTKSIMKLMKISSIKSINQTSHLKHHGVIFKIHRFPYYTHTYYTTTTHKWINIPKKYLLWWIISNFFFLFFFEISTTDDA